MKGKLFFILFIILITSCSKKESNNILIISDENIMEQIENTKVTSEELTIENIIDNVETVRTTTEELAARNIAATELRIATETAQAAQGFSKLMYVTAKSGLRERSEPSINGNIFRTLEYGEMIQVFAKTDLLSTVEDISSYWYRTRFYEYDNRWIFGGYLSEELPDEFPTITGLWDVVGDEQRYFRFNLDYRYSEGYKGTGIGLFGVWSLNGNTVTIEIRRYSDLFADVYEIIMEYDIKINFIDRNNIELELPQDIYTEQNVILTRNRSGR